jgi:hypothetical protein
MRALWMVAALIGIAILIFAHATVLGIVVGIAFLGLAVSCTGGRSFAGSVSVTGSSIHDPLPRVLATVTRQPRGQRVDDRLAEMPRRYCSVSMGVSLFRLAALDVEPIGVGGPEALAFDVLRRPWRPRWPSRRRP